jgi:hypothetical protein
MSFKIGDRVFHRGTRGVGVVVAEPRSGEVEVRASDGRIEFWSLADTLRDHAGAEDPFQPGHGHVSDPHENLLRRRRAHR